MPQRVQGLQPSYHRCPSRKCTRRHWFITWRVVLWPVFRLELHEPPRHILGRDELSLRQTLSEIPALDEDTIEWVVFVMTMSGNVIPDGIGAS